MAGSDVTLPHAKLSIFDRWSWFYAFCREWLFADHTKQIAAHMRPMLQRTDAPVLLEVGCGPGFYSGELAKLFPQLSVVGVDLSHDLLQRAQRRAARRGLTNCSFMHIDAIKLADTPDTADFLIASRLFLILENRRSTLDAMYITLRPGGQLFIAEPVSRFRSAIPLVCMRLLEFFSGHPFRAQSDPTECRVLTNSQFADLVASQPWSSVKQWSDYRYQYAICEKAS